MTLGDDFVSRCIVKRAAKRINDAGGCDVKDEYSKGYDDTITLAINILWKKQGMCWKMHLMMEKIRRLKQYE